MIDESITQDFEVGDHVEVIAKVYFTFGIKKGQRGRIVAQLDEITYHVLADVSNSRKREPELWPLYAKELKKVEP